MMMLLSYDKLCIFFYYPSSMLVISFYSIELNWKFAFSMRIYHNSNSKSTDYFIYLNGFVESSDPGHNTQPTYAFISAGIKVEDRPTRFVHHVIPQSH